MNIQESVSLADKTWFKTGGAARYFAQPTTYEEFASALTFANEHKLSLFILGHGANVLISDNGFDGLVIQPVMNSITIHKKNTGTFVTAQAGASLQGLISYCLDNHLLGLEEFSGIPGTVGGSVYINVHYFEFLLEHFLTEAVVINRTTLEITRVSNEWFQFSYNYSTLHKRTHYLLCATFKVHSVSREEAAYARGRRDEIIRYRSHRYPTHHTCGSFFRNFTPAEVAHTKEAIPFVAYYLDVLGVKGKLSHGDARVSSKHANMIENIQAATSTDIITVAKTMQKKVFDSFGILPQPECQLIGFEESPLLNMSYANIESSI